MGNTTMKPCKVCKQMVLITFRKAKRKVWEKGGKHVCFDVPLMEEGRTTLPRDPFTKDYEQMQLMWGKL